MLAEGWIYGNARITEEKADGFFVRVCGPKMREYKQELLSLSKQMLEGMSRDCQEECWAAGYLDEKRQAYVIAVAGNQEHLLHMKLSCRENRGFFCVMAYLLPKEAIALYERDSEMFEPLKEQMRSINQKMPKAAVESIELCFKPYQLKMEDGRKFESRTLKKTEEVHPLNLLRSTKEKDEAVWRKGLQHLVVTGMASELAAKQILEKFPVAIVTVRGNAVKEMYCPYQAPRRTETKKRRQPKPYSQYKKVVKMCYGELKGIEIAKIKKFEDQDFRNFCYLYCWIYKMDKEKNGKQERVWKQVECVLQSVTGKTDVVFPGKKWNEWAKLEKKWSEWVKHADGTAEEINRQLAKQIGYHWIERGM